jgi:hypothetical protein
MLPPDESVLTIGVPTTDYSLFKHPGEAGEAPRSGYGSEAALDVIESHLNIKIVVARPGVAGFGSGISHRAPSPVCPRAARNSRSYCAMTGFRQSFRYRSMKWPDAGAPGRSHDREDRAPYRHRLCSSETDPGCFGRVFQLLIRGSIGLLIPGPRTLHRQQSRPRLHDLDARPQADARRSRWHSSRFCRCSCCRAFSASSTACRAQRIGEAFLTTHIL